MNEITTTPEGGPPALAPLAEGSMMNFIAQALENPNIDPAKLEALLRIQDGREAKEAERQFNIALHAAQAEMPRVSKNGTIDFGGKGKMKFATWEDMDTVLRPVMQRHGFSISFDMRAKGAGMDGAIVTATLLHVSGHTKTIEMPLPYDSGAGRNALQAVGSTLSYGKRYLSEMLFNIVRTAEDDDGKLGGTVRITADQKEQLVQLMQQAKTDTPKFLEYFQIETLDGMAQKDFTRAANMLNTKIQKGPGA